jgi:[citrate (pro-3S)-lyase] ligase
MMTDYQIHVIDLSEAPQVNKITAFLARFGLNFDLDVDYTIALEKRDVIIGTGSFAGEVLRNIAVDDAFQGEGLTAVILNELVQEQARRHIMHRLIFTKPSAAARFLALGFREIARAEPWAVLLESGIDGIGEYLARIAGLTKTLPSPRTGIVVNCNPFTRGHLGLIETAARDSKAVIVFVVKEDRSLFPFQDRFDLIRCGLAHLSNVTVVDTGIYMVSAATFPTYFTREEHLATAQAHLDVALFAQTIAPALNINARYVGEEPYSAVTEAYNQAMRDILPKRGISLKVIPRFTAPSGRIISASIVRESIRQDDWKGLRELVPDVTWEYLTASSHADIIQKIKTSHSRH